MSESKVTKPTSSSETSSRTTRSTYKPDELDTITKASIPLHKLKEENYRPILDAIGPNTSIVMIGEASHGTEEFYEMRADITRRLITDHGFQFVSLESDWPDTYRLNRWVQRDPSSKDKTAEEALSDYTRFPRWMWHNHVVADFAKWLRQHNEKVDKNRRVGIYGLDLYSMYTSSEKVIEYLDEVDPRAAEMARQRYGTLSQYEEDPHSYAYALELGLVESQQQHVARVLTDLNKKRMEYMTAKGGVMDGDEFFCSEINAKVVKDAEEYYRKAFSGGAVTWNLRDYHMFETLQDLMRYHEQRAQRPTDGDRKSVPPSSSSSSSKLTGSSATATPPVRGIIWAHNTHIHDARASDMAKRHEYNIGQLVRQRIGIDKSFSIGFSTYDGTVSASTKWGAPRQTIPVNPSLPGSYEHLLHEATLHYVDKVSREEKGKKIALNKRGLSMLLRSNNETVAPVDRNLHELLMNSRLQRAIGVQYIRQRERTAHYHFAVLPQQFNYEIHIDRTHALRPLDKADSAGADERILQDEEMEEEETAA